MGNRPEWIQLDFAAKLIGALPVGINTWSTGPELEYVLGHAGTAMLVTADQFLKSDFLALMDTLRPWSERLPMLRKVVVVGEGGRADTIPFAGIEDAGAAVSEAELDRLSIGVRPGDHAILLYTSGSTSKPKGVLLAHRGLIENTWNIGARLHLDENDRVWLAVSLFWALGSVNALYAAFTHGAALVLQESFEAGAALGLIAATRCTALYGTPNMLTALLDHPEHDRYDLSCVRKCATIGTPDQMRRVIRELAPMACQIYGMTETYGNCAVTDANDPVELRANTVGAPLPGQRIRIVDPANGWVLSQGETGEIRVKGHVMQEYYRDPVRTTETFDAEGWLRTGDLGFLGADGRLRFRGRIKEMVKSGGINIAPAEVEETLHAHPAIAQAYVVGVPDPRRDEVLAAVIVPRPGVAVALEELAVHCAAQLSAYKVPRLWRVVEETDLPLTVTGKLQKNRLAELFAADN
jgi:fatty-acyl-CoA synthase